MKQKFFIITVDTEGDNLWNYQVGNVITTNNADYIPKFQCLCDNYGFKPVYLTNYEMALCERFVTEANKWLAEGKCEVGIHLHAWNNPPEYSLEGKYNYNPYLIEYPTVVMEQKFKVIYELIKKNFNITPISHRAGRWAMDERYFEILSNYGILVDCSYTPGINWSGNVGVTRGGSDYSKIYRGISYIGDVLEVPVTIRKIHYCLDGKFKHRVRTLLMGEYVWPRPATQSAKMIQKLIDKLADESDCDYVEFMIHSSELMPGGSPYFKTSEDVKALFHTMDDVFKYAHSKGYVGVTLAEYYDLKKNG